MENNIKNLKLFNVSVSYTLPVAAENAVEAKKLIKKVLETEDPSNTGFVNAVYIPQHVDDIRNVLSGLRDCPVYNTMDVVALMPQTVIDNDRYETRKKEIKNSISNVISKAKANGYTFSKEEIIELVKQDDNLV